MRVEGRASSSARSLRAKCQTQFVCGVSADSSAEGSAAVFARPEQKLTALTEPGVRSPVSAVLRSGARTEPESEKAECRGAQQKPASQAPYQAAKCREFATLGGRSFSPGPRWRVVRTS